MQAEQVTVQSKLPTKNHKCLGLLMQAEEVTVQFYCILALYGE